MENNYQYNLTVSGRRSGSDRRIFNDPHYNGTERRITKDRRNGTRKRKHTRFRPEDVTFVSLRSESEEDMGELLDISKGGLSFSYFIKARRFLRE